MKLNRKTFANTKPKKNLVSFMNDKNDDCNLYGYDIVTVLERLENRT